MILGRDAISVVTSFVENYRIIACHFKRWTHFVTLLAFKRRASEKILPTISGALSRSFNGNSGLENKSLFHHLLPATFLCLCNCLAVHHKQINDAEVEGTESAQAKELEGEENHANVGRN